eukprot:g28456.t1
MERDKTGPQVQVLNWHKANFDGIRQELAGIDWNSLFACKGTSGKWEAFKSVIARLQDLYVPVKMKGKVGRRRETWMTIDIKALSRKKEAWLRNRELGSWESLEVYKGYWSLLKKEIGRVKRGREIALAKRFFENIKEKRINGERIGSLKDKSGHVCMEPQEMGEVINEYFSTAFIVEKDMKTWELGEVSGDNLRTVHITVEEVLDVLE